MTSNPLPDHSDAEDDQVCIDDYPEHDYESQGEADGSGAEYWEEASDVR